jgi:urease accessory protein
VWLLLQLADAAFPTGGFAHSAGLEAAFQLGEVKGARDLERFVVASAWQAGLGALPFVRASYEDPERIVEHDRACNAFLSSHVANRASRTQGRALLTTCARVFEAPAIQALDAAARRDALFAHLAPAFGAATRALGVPLRDAQGLYLHTATRGVLSAAVRLGLAGPHEAQRMQHAHQSTLEHVLSACEGLSLDDIAQPAPLLDLFGATQDRLYSRLFQS